MQVQTGGFESKDFSVCVTDESGRFTRNLALEQRFPGGG